jgi:hypothetical protein
MKLRIGVMLWALSWVPYGVILGLSGWALTLSWAFEVLLGVSGLALAGSEFAQAVKVHGWRGAPAAAWRAFRSSRTVDGEPARADAAHE